MSRNVDPLAETKPTAPLIGARSLMPKLVLSIVLAVVTYAVILFYADYGAFVVSIKGISGSALLIATALSLSNFAIRYVRWEYYLSRLGIRVPRLESALIFVAGFAMSITPAKMGEVLKSMMLRASHEVPVRKSAPIVIAERITDMAGLLLLGSLGLLDKPWGVMVALALVACVALLAILVGSARVGTWTISQLGRIKKLARAQQVLTDLHGSLSALVTPSAFVIGTLLSVIAWATHGLALWVIASTFANMSLSVADAMMAYSAPLLAGTLAMIPGGIGLTEASMAGVLITEAGATGAESAAVSILIRVLTFWSAIALGLLALGCWRLVARPTARTESVDDEARA